MKHFDKSTGIILEDEELVNYIAGVAVGLVVFGVILLGAFVGA